VVFIRKEMGRLTKAFLENKPRIIESALERIRNGDTLEEVAKDNRISKPTLWRWLSALGDEYTELRELLIDEQLADAGEKLDDAITNASDEFGVIDYQKAQLNLAHARELWKKSTWLAEMRSSRYKRADAAPIINNNLTITPILMDRLSAVLPPVLNHVPEPEGGGVPSLEDKQTPVCCRVPTLESLNTLKSLSTHQSIPTLESLPTSLPTSQSTATLESTLEEDND